MQHEEEEMGHQPPAGRGMMADGAMGDGSSTGESVFSTALQRTPIPVVCAEALWF